MADIGSTLPEERPRWADLADSSEDIADPSLGPLAHDLTFDPSYWASKSSCAACENLNKSLNETDLNEPRPPEASRQNILSGPTPNRERDLRISDFLGGIQNSSATQKSVPPFFFDNNDLNGSSQPSKPLSASSAAFVPSRPVQINFSALLDIPLTSSATVSDASPQPTAPAVQLALDSLLPPPVQSPLSRTRITGKRPGPYPHPSDFHHGKHPKGDRGRTAAQQGEYRHEKSSAAVEPIATQSSARKSGNTSNAVPAAPVAPCAPPPATEEDWQRRLGKRHNAVASTKCTSEYHRFSEMRDSGTLVAPVVNGECVPAPCTPEPTDRSISKRRWEDEVRQWRALLRIWCPGDGDTDDMQLA